MNAPIKLAPPAAARRLTAAERVERAIQRFGQIPKSVALRAHGATAIARLELAAEAHASTAEAYMREAQVFDDRPMRLAWLEFAGLHAVTAQALQAKADELRGGA